MKNYEMLQTVQGSRDGLKVETFTKGETYELDATLAEQFYHQGAVKEAASDTDDSNSAPNLREGFDPRDRSTKVSGPTETKVTGPEEPNATSSVGEAGVPLQTQHIEELVAVARDHYGLDVNSTMSPEAVKALIEDAKAKNAEPATTETDTAKTKSAEPKTTGKRSK